MTPRPLADVSHKAYVILLAHYSPRDAKRGTKVPADVAELLVRRLAAERITQNVYRLLPPNSVFAKLIPTTAYFVPLKLGSGEIPGVKFVPPASAIASTVPRSRSLPRRREIYGDWQLAMSLLPTDPCPASSTTS